jgi:predicted RNA polymerase sigma factor
VALTLRALGGLRTDEIARAFLVPEPTMKRRAQGSSRCEIQNSLAMLEVCWD